MIVNGGGADDDNCGRDYDDDNVWQVAGEDSLANSFILSLLDTEVTTAQEFLQKWVSEHKFVILVFNNWYVKMVMVVFLSLLSLK